MDFLQATYYFLIPSLLESMFGLPASESTMTNDILAAATTIAVTVALFLVRHFVLTVGKSRKNTATVSSSKRAATLRAVRSLDNTANEEIRSTGGELREEGAAKVTGHGFRRVLP